MKFGICHSTSCEFTVVPTIVIAPGIGFHRFSALIHFMFWGIGFYGYRRSDELDKR